MVSNRGREKLLFLDSVFRLSHSYRKNALIKPILETFDGRYFIKDCEIFAILRLFFSIFQIIRFFQCSFIIFNAAAVFNLPLSHETITLKTTGMMNEKTIE